MDPSTTLMTFMLETFTSTKSVSLIGSWDNFSARYALEKDVRRGRGQWRGCYAFKNIVCDGESSTSTTRDGGLKMGHTYWYYYELDDGTEFYDESLPCTTACPYLPGQPVNLLAVPIQMSQLRERSASEGTSLGGFQTLRPQDKFIAPRAIPPLPKLTRLETSAGTVERKRSARSISPKEARPQWSARSLFARRESSSAVETRFPSPDPWDLWEEQNLPGSHRAESGTPPKPTSQKSSMRSRSSSYSSLHTPLDLSSSQTLQVCMPPTRAAPAVPTIANEPRLPSRAAPPPPSTQQRLFNVTSRRLSEVEPSQTLKVSPQRTPEVLETDLLRPPVSPNKSFRHSRSSRRRSPLSFIRNAVKDLKPLPSSSTNNTISQRISSTPPSYAESCPFPSHLTSTVTSSTLSKPDGWPLPNNDGFNDHEAPDSTSLQAAQSLDITMSARNFHPLNADSPQLLSSTSSICELTDDDDEGELPFSGNSSRLSRMNPWSRTSTWQGYGLPLEDISSDLTIKPGPKDLKDFHTARNDRESLSETERLPDIEALREALRKAFAPNGNENGEGARDSLLFDLGYLGEMIVA